MLLDSHNKYTPNQFIKLNGMLKENISYFILSWNKHDKKDIKEIYYVQW